MTSQLLGRIVVVLAALAVAALVAALVPVDAKRAGSTRPGATAAAR